MITKSPHAGTISQHVFCTLQVEGIHQWSECPLEEVEYLRHPHRHLFHVKAILEVTHSNRDVEFIVLKHDIGAYINLKYFDSGWNLCNFGNMSCEMIAKDLLIQFDLTSCEVSEDGENGAIVSYRRL